MRSLMVMLLLVMVALSGCIGGGDDEDNGGLSDGGSGDGEETGGDNDGTNGTSDTDGDGVPDGEDVCEGHDDNVDSDGDGTPDGCDDTPGGDPDPEPRDPVTWQISIQGNDFVDGSITIQVGDTVTWVHEDGTTPHTVTSDDGTSFDSGACPGPGCMAEDLNGEFSHTFDEVGSFDYFCRVHPSMTDTITVLAVHEGTPG